MLGDNGRTGGRLNTRKAIFLDRDGVLNRDPGYTHTIEEWEWLPGAREGLELFHDRGWTVLVVSNQSGIGRGLFTREQVDLLHHWVSSQVPGLIDGWYICPHAPGDNCSCRKPLPGMLLKAASEHSICLQQSWMLGDKLSDVQAGLNAGTKAGLIGPEPVEAAVPRWPDLWSAATCLAVPGVFC